MRWTKAAVALWSVTARARAFGIPATCGRRRTTSTTTALPWLTTVQRGGGGTAVPPSSSSSVCWSTSTADTTTTTTPTEYFRRDYAPLPYTVEKVRMDFRIGDNDSSTTVTTELDVTLRSTETKSMVLDGDVDTITLQDVHWKTAASGEVMPLVEGQDYTLTDSTLTITTFPTTEDGGSNNSSMTLVTTVSLDPSKNTALSGLYTSGTMVSTQCEAMGFRRITYFPDRPDVMAVFERVRIESTTKHSDVDTPVLLSNGNLVEQGTTATDNHPYAIWSDPFPKPSYLFALVAGNQLQVLDDTFVTRSGRTVQLRMYADASNVHQLQYAMAALQRSMQWDEERFGLEYDLDIFHVVAVSDFNMGAMENKSLNIFNTAYVLADIATATDRDFQLVEAVIGHEYFHNWTGNRVTCRDWFQLTLKEGLTVFRDQEFSADMMQSPTVKRIEDVRGLRARQFPEDAGPMAHPIRPESYISMDNFYTATVYVKGAEIIRMVQTLLGRDGFRKGMDLYFERHDGSAVTCDDFVAAMADANSVNLDQFRRWYSTAGTPTVTAETNYSDGTLKLTLSQKSLSTEGPLHIPISVGLLDKKTGKEVVPTTVLELKEDTQTFSFENLDDDVEVSILRGFSAPVKLTSNEEDGEGGLAFLAANDTDGFNRWEAGQKLYTSLIFQAMSESGMTDVTMSRVEEAFRNTLESDSTENALLAYALTLPSESTLAEEEALEVVDPIQIHEARGAVKKGLARKFQSVLQAKYDEMTVEMANETDLKVDGASIGRRLLRNVLLEYLCSIRNNEEEQVTAAELASQHYANAKGMTDKMAAFNCVASMDGKGAETRDRITQTFYDQANDDDLVLNKWFTVQATADLPDILDRVKALKEHPKFTLRNPNRCRSLIGAYTSANPAAFHDEAGDSYKFLGEMLVELDKLNPQVSSRMAGGLIQWRKYSEERGGKMKAELEKLSKLKLSKDLFEIVNKGLK